MAAVVLGVDSPNTAASPVASGAFTPAAGDLLIVFCGASATVAAAPTCASSVGGQTFSLIRVQIQGLTHEIAAFVSNAFATAVSQTVTVTHTGDASTGQVQTVLRVSGMLRSGLDAIRQSASEETGIAFEEIVTFAIAPLTENPIVGGYKNNSNPAAMTPPASFTERSDSGYATPTAGMQTVSRDSGHTSVDVLWGSVSATLGAAMILELDTSPTPPLPYRNPMPPLIAQ